MEEKYIGLILALSSSVLIGASFIITKKALMESSRRVGGCRAHVSQVVPSIFMVLASAGDTYAYLSSSLWWAGMVTMVAGEIANFAAYSYAPAILVTPLGAGSVLLSAILASIFLGEKLGTQGTIGCALCIIGSVIIILHSPKEKDIKSVQDILDYSLQPAFLIYMFIVIVVSLYLIYDLGPKYGKQNMLIYITICSLVGSISVMAVKGFGIALKLTLAGHNQFWNLSTYVFLITVVVCAMTQMNYFNKSLDLFSTNRVTPIYYVFFTTATILASVLLFQGFNDTSASDVVTIFSGFFTIFIGVFQLNSSKGSSHSRDNVGDEAELSSLASSDGDTLRLDRIGKSMYQELEEE